MSATDQASNVTTAPLYPYFDTGYARGLDDDAAMSQDLGDAATETVNCESGLYCADSSDNEIFQEMQGASGLGDGQTEGAFSTFSAQAAPSVTGNWGISDENTDIFSDPGLLALNVRWYRKIVPWDIALPAEGNNDCWRNNFTARKQQGFKAWYEAVSKLPNVKVFVSFEHNPCRLLRRERQRSPASYAAAYNAFRTAFPEIRHFSAWNEPNNGTQPWGRTKKERDLGVDTAPRAREAGVLYNTLRRECDRVLPAPAAPVTQPIGVNTPPRSAPKCGVVAGDFLDSGLSSEYLSAYKRGGNLRGKAVPWAIHPYRTVKDQDLGVIQPFMKATNGKVWVTEGGAFFQWFKRVRPGSEGDPDRDGKIQREPVVDYGPSKARQGLRVKWLVSTLVRERPRITHFFYYQWADRGDPIFDPSGNLLGGGDGFGTGLVRNAADPTQASEAQPEPYCSFKNRNKSRAVLEATCDPRP